MGILEKVFGPPNVGKLTVKRNLNGLAKALVHRMPSVRRDAAIAVRQLCDGHLLSGLLPLLWDPAPEVQAEAQQSLAALAATLPEVVASALDTPDKKTRDAVARVLITLPTTPVWIQALAAAVLALDFPDSERKQSLETLLTLQTLATLKDRRAFHSVAEQLRSNEKEIRLAAIKVLGALGDIRAIEPLKDAVFDDPDRDIQLAFATALGDLPHSRAVNLLIAKSMPFGFGHAEDQSLHATILHSLLRLSRHVDHPALKQFALSPSLRAGDWRGRESIGRLV